MGKLAPVTGLEGSRILASNVAELKKTIITTLGPAGVMREFGDLGVRFEGGVKVNGKIVAHAIDREDANPSAVVFGNSGVYYDMGSGEKGKSLFDFALAQAPDKFPDIWSCLKFYASVAGVPVDGRKDHNSRVLEDTYDYTDRDGNLKYQVLRYLNPTGKKTFKQRHPDGKGDWIWNLDGVERVLYALPILATHPHAICYFVEGDKGAKQLNIEFDRGGWLDTAVSTTNAQGANDHTPERWAQYAQDLAGRGVVVIADNDAQGRQHAHFVCSVLQPVCRSIKLLELPGVGRKGDISDWLDQGHTLDELWPLVLATPPWDPAAPPPEERPGDEPAEEEEEVMIVGSMADVQCKPVPWLWRGRVPYRFISTFAGRTGLGKSFVTCDIAARLSRGLEWPDLPGVYAPLGRTLFISEDVVEYMLAPRLEAMGADMAMISYMKWEAMAEYTLENIEMLERAVRQAGDPIFIVIDPPSNFLGDADEHKNSEVRRVLMKLASWLEASERDRAMELITHINKSIVKGIDALTRVLGSVAFTSVPRIVHAFAPDAEDPERRIFVPVKSNLGMMPKGLGYRIVETPTLARVEWLGEVDISADEALDRDRKPTMTEAGMAATWLREYLTGGPQPSDECVARGNLACGLDRPSYWWRDKVLKAIGGMPRKDGFQGKSLWILVPQPEAMDVIPVPKDSPF